MQRDVRVKNGPSYAAAGELPQPGIGDDPAIRNQADAAGTYLVRSAGDLRRRAGGQAAPMLTPHRHLIGEAHNRSQFERALSDWDWGAEKMGEGFQTSAVVPDEVSGELRGRRRVGLVTNPYYQIRELENLHAYLLSGLAAVVLILKEVENNVGYARQCAQNVADRQNVDTNKRQFSTAEDVLSRNRKNFRSHWSDDVAAYLPSYRRAGENRLRGAPRGPAHTPANRLHDLATFMSPRWDRFTGNAVYIGKRPYGVLDGWQETADKLATYRTNVNNFRTAGLETLAGHLINLTKAEAAQSNLPGNPDLAIDQGWQTATAADAGAMEILQGGSQIREPFMVHNINNNLQNLPALVMIGRAHVTNLRNANSINQGKYHDSYTDFEQDTLA